MTPKCLRNPPPTKKLEKMVCPVESYVLLQNNVHHTLKNTRTYQNWHKQTKLEMKIVSTSHYTSINFVFKNSLYASRHGHRQTLAQFHPKYQSPKSSWVGSWAHPYCCNSFRPPSSLEPRGWDRVSFRASPASWFRVLGATRSLSWPCEQEHRLVGRSYTPGSPWTAAGSCPAMLVYRWVFIFVFFSRRERPARSFALKAAQTITDRGCFTIGTTYWGEYADDPDGRRTVVLKLSNCRNTLVTEHDGGPLLYRPVRVATAELQAFLSHLLSQKWLLRWSSGFEGPLRKQPMSDGPAADVQDAWEFGLDLAADRNGCCVISLLICLSVLDEFLRILPVLLWFQWLSCGVELQELVDWCNRNVKTLFRSASGCNLPQITAVHWSAQWLTVAVSDP